MLRLLVSTLVVGASLGVLSDRAQAEDPTPEKPVTLRIATMAPEGTPWAKLMDLYKKKVEARTNKRVIVKVYLGGKAGGENETVTKAVNGQLQAVAASTGAVASVVPELLPIEMPFLFNGFKEADYILDEVLTKPMEEHFAKRGLVLGFWSENGFRHFGSNFGLIKTPKDLEGKKMRSQESRIHTAMWKAFKSSGNALPTTEVLTALSATTVEGFDQGLLFTIAAKWHKAVKFFTLSAHIYQPAVACFNKKWFDALPLDIQQALVEEGRAIQGTGRKLIRALIGDLVTMIKKELGDTEAEPHVYDLTTKDKRSERAAFVAATRVVRDDFMADAKVLPTVKATLKAIEDGLAAFRK